MKKILFFIFSFFIITNIAFADSKCSYNEQAELLNKATNIKASYEIESEVVHFVDMDANVDYFNVLVSNVTEDFYVVIKNDYNTDVSTLRYTDAKDGVIYYRWNNLEKVTNITIEVFASGNTNCANEKYKTLYIQTPRYNEYFDREVCEELTDFYLCQKYTTSTVVTEDRFFEQLESYQNGKIDDKGEEIDNRNVFDKVFEFIKDNKWYILGGVIVITGGIVFINRKRNKKSRELGL